MLSNKGTGSIDGITRTWLQFAAAIIVLLPYVLLGGGFQIHTIQRLGLVNLLTVGVVHTGIMYYWYFSSLSHLRGQQVALLSYIDPMVAVVLSVVFLRESIGLWQLVGGLLILVATAFNELKFKRDY